MARDFDDDDERDQRGQRRSYGDRQNRRDMIDLGPEGAPTRRRYRDRDDGRGYDRDDRRYRDDPPPSSARGRDDRDDGEADDRPARRDRRDDGPARDERREADRPQRDQDEKNDGKASDKANDDGKDQDAAAQQSRRNRRPLILTIVAIVVLLGLAAGAYYYFTHRNQIDTDDAYTDGNVITIAPQVSGQVVSLEVNDNQFVHKGDVLVRIDARQFQYDREQAQGTLDAEQAQVASQRLGVEIAKKNFPAGLQLAKANLESAQANLALQKSNYDRQKSLPKQATTQQEVDAATSNYQQAQAQVDQAEARVAQAEPVPQNIGQTQEQVKQIQGQAEQAQGRLDQANLNVEWSVVRAPQDGWVTRRNVNAGNYVSAGTQIMSLVTTDVWVTANYKETQLDGMRPGQQVKISVDAYPDLDLHGHVDSIQRGSGSRFSAFPAENATGNFIKIVQRVPVKIVIDSGLHPDEPLPLGVSVVPTVLTK